MQTKPTRTIRLKSWIEPRDDGWYCVAGFWWVARGQDVGDGRTDCDDSLAVGPLPSRQVARAELRGDFRQCVTGALAQMQRQGGRIVAAEFGQDGGAA